MKDEWIIKSTSLQLKLLLKLVKGFFISNAVTVTAKRCRNISISITYPNEILKILGGDEIRAAKNLPANSSSDLIMYIG